MKKTSVSLYVLCVVFCVGNAGAALRIGNSGTGRGGTYAAPQGSEIVVQQQAEMQEMLETAQNSTELGLPVRVANMDMARAIASGQFYNGVSMANLDSCANIFPNGSFAWDRANAGLKTSSGCVAEVELRKIEGTEDIILARARVAAGGSIDCNIDAFPADGLTIEAGKVIFPADREPTLAEVKQAMNQEQKQGAGLKIAAAALIGGIGGNFLGQNDPGKGGMIGTSGDKMKKTAIGAVALGGATAVSTQTGKIGGDVVMGATVNAIGGGLIGNMSGIGEAVLLIKKCEGYDCLYGIVSKVAPITGPAFWGNLGSMVKCTESTKDGKTIYEQCGVSQIPYWRIGQWNQDSKIEDINREMMGKGSFCLIDGKMEDATVGCDGGEGFYKLDSAEEMTSSEPAVIVDWDARKYKTYADFKTWRAGGPKNVDIRFRYADGTIGKQAVGRDGTTFTARDFNALTQDATDGGIIDLNNKARTGATATGAGIGAGLGAFSSFQGAKDEVENRHVAEVTAYKDSLTKFYCATGKRFLSQYNEVVIIPNEK
ncbi:MAG: hypothetical protein FWE50_00485 [Alphaproteobacteria bacterium]|nr:hypothetical protein [Alphaproteobacteria bacterium]